MRVDIDRCYREGCRRLSAEQQETARGLPHRLGLAPRPDIPWSDVFQHEVTLSAPALFVDAMPSVDERSIEQAVTSHLFAVIEAFASDRLHDGQVADDEGRVRRLISGLRSVRDRSVVDMDPDAKAAFAIADRDVRDAQESERELFGARRAVSIHRYEKLSLQKQAIGFPASLALARSYGFEPQRRALVRAALAGVWLGLQFADDVLDWEDDFQRGGAWAVCIARSMGTVIDSDELPVVQKAVHASGVLARMMTLARQRFEAARGAASELGALVLADWAESQRVRVAELAEGEEKAPGYTLRAHALRHLARLVMK